MTLESPPLRADALRNRGAIICAAASLFAIDGVNVTLERVAHAAGVGVATVYRRFPTIDSLISVVLEKKMIGFADRAQQAADDAALRPWEAFRDFVLYIVEEQAADFGFSEIVRSTSRCDDLFPEQSRRAVAASAALITRARDAGVVRPDLVPADLHLLMSANSGVIRELHSREASTRLAELLLEAYRSGARSSH